MEELISIIVLSYNSESTIIKTLDSILNQTYKSLEIIVTDDCSNDATIDLVKEWKARHSSIINVVIVTTSQNTGVSANANRGLKAANARIVKILAADDTLEPNAISLYWKYYKNDHKKVIYQSKVNLIDENDQQIVSDSNSMYPNLKRMYYKMKSEKQRMDLLKSNFIVSPAIGLISMETFKRCGYYDERFSMIEDYPFFLKLSEHGYTFKLINHKLVNYRFSSASICRSKRSKSRDKYLVSYAKFILLVKLKLIIKNKMYLTALQDLLRALKSLFIVYVYHKGLDIVRIK